MNNPVNHIKAVVVGDGAVGKTAMLLSYTQNKLPTDYVPTVFDNYSCNVMVDKDVVNLGLWDTAGQEDFDRLRPLSYYDCDIFIVCYSLLSPTSFENVKTRWLPEIMKYVTEKTKIMLVGTKLDLYNDSKILSHLARHGQKRVELTAGLDLCNKVKGMKTMNCSALTQENLKDVFDLSIRSVMESRFPHRYNTKTKNKKGNHHQGKTFFLQKLWRRIKS